MQNLSELTRRLVESKVEFFLIGGFAAVAHGATLVTHDVEICWRFSEANLKRIQHARGQLHPVHRSRPDLPLDLTPEQCSSLKNLYLKTDLGVVDCLSEVRGIGDLMPLWCRAWKWPCRLGPVGFWASMKLLSRKKNLKHLSRRAQVAFRLIEMRSHE